MVIENDERNYCDDFQEVQVFLIRFLKNYQLLVDRYNRFKELGNVFIGERDEKRIIDRFTYFDMIIVQLRAMCIENKKSNYTLQNLLTKTGNDNLAKRIEEMLDRPFVGGVEYSASDNSKTIPLTIRNALKIVADKFVCHYDGLADNYSLYSGLTLYIEVELGNPHAQINLDFIMDTISACVNEGFKNYLEQYKSE